MMKPALAVLVLALAGANLAADEVKRVKPVNLVINSKDDDDEPHVSSNGLTLYYAIKSTKGKPVTACSTRTATTRPWGAPKIFEAFFATEEDVRGVFVTPEGVFPQVLYFGLFARDKEDPEKGNWDLS